MQPYFFPYIGYFQLLSSVDKFIFYDDVNFIKGGWVNRNRLFLAGSIRYVTVPLVNASSFDKINQISSKLSESWIDSLNSSLYQSYRKAPYYKEVISLIDAVLRSSDGTIGSVSKASIVKTAMYLGIEKNFVMSSAIYGNQEKSSSDRVIDICKLEGCTEYWNLPGGRVLYDQAQFQEQSIDLRFVDVKVEPYPQFSPEFIPGLSILDILMFNSPEVAKKMVRTGTLNE